jgi:peptidoglycan/xylan/chitin deacetylase (PgdA/CDA1 family)
MVPIYYKFSGAKKVALTIDDGPNPETTPLLLDCLEKNGKLATFFLSGDRCEKNLSLIDSIRAAGHSICSHGYRHVNYLTLSNSEIFHELQMSEEIFSSIQSSLMPGRPIRLPYGAGVTNSRILDIMNQVNPKFRLIQWSWTPLGWNFLHNNIRSCNDVNLQVKSCMQPYNENSTDISGSIILLHDWSDRPLFCATLLRKVIEKYADYKFVRL